MNLAILGYGKEGHSAQKYFEARGDTVQIFDGFSLAELKTFDLRPYDLVLRSPSVPPLYKIFPDSPQSPAVLASRNWSSLTKYFFDNCPAPIIGVTGTKGKGTTCSLITTILEHLGFTAHLVGNIGTPAIDLLDKISPSDVIVYELSSFQLWDLEVSPKISVVLRVEPDHLNVHRDYADYVSAKSNLCRLQTPSDSCIFFKNNPDSAKIAQLSPAQKFPYPLSEKSELLDNLFFFLNVPGAHNRENAEAALLAVSAFLDQPLPAFLEDHFDQLKSAFKSFRGLPHRLEFVRTKDGIKFYDDNFSTTTPSLEVALRAFPNDRLVLIAGGRDKTDYADLPAIAKLLTSTKNLEKVVLLGESGHKLYSDFPSAKFLLADSLADAVEKSFSAAKLTSASVVLMSPAAASFDMFENVYDRGAQYQTIVKNL